ncbi:hypothetical protein F444_13436 [Phytophthora nicotianae P1976]|uniref:BZIP domain-containing protein n=1 Tax=Phytophthora nicotianae P1976 TaxID=1317066 RepID=A0A080ZTT7_PHYNI|nr:hypothetical protein F444_13436 [Phytophthora nicotianae P1976]
MTELITTDEVLFDDIVGLLDFNGSLTPRLSIGDTDGLTAALFNETTDPASPSTDNDDNTKHDKQSRKREREKTRQRRYRQRLRDSRDVLQRQVDELSKELQRLNKQAAMRRELEISTDVLTNSQWVSERVRQQEQRALSEAEHKRLVAAVNYQASYIEGLRQVVGNRLNGNAVPFGTDNSFNCFKNVPTLHSMTSALYTTYLQQLEGSYARVDSVLNACGLMTMPETTVNTTHRREADGEVAYFQHVNKVLLPYSFQKICEAIWTTIHEQEEPAFGGYETAPDDDVFIKSRVLTSLNVGTLVQRFISRYYMEENRLVFVWKMSTEGEGDFSGLHAEETAWMSVRPTAAGVVLEVCVQQVPMRFNLASTHEPAVAMFHNMLHESLEADKNEMSKKLESLLLNDVLTGIEC